MTGESERPVIAQLGRVPPDMLDALKADFTILGKDDLVGLDGRARSAITHGLTSAMAGAPAEVLDMLPGLSAIASVGAGADLFDLSGLAARGIELRLTADVMTEDAAEMAVGLVFALLRNIVGNDGFVRQGDWATGRAPLGHRISGRRIGIVGLGRIGTRIAGKLDALGCEIAYAGRTEKDVPWRFERDVERLAESVDVLVLSCAGGDATRGLVDGRVLGALGQDGYLVNVSRGSVVDEPALIDALERRAIAGAALDVFENEPTPDPRFLNLSNCILQPHAAVFTRDNRRDLAAALRLMLCQ